MAHSIDDRLTVVLAGLPIFFILITTLRRFIENRLNRPSPPPGPVALPLLGNILSINAKEPWLTYTEWRAAYGDLVSVRLLGQEVVVINSLHVAQALLDKRSRIYSDRPYLATRDPFGWTFNFAFTGYSDVWRLSRRLFHQTFRPDSALKFRPMQIRRAREMIVNLIDDPQHYHSHFATFSSSVTLSAVYDYEPSARDDSVVRLVENSLELGLAVMTPEKAITLKTFPFRKLKVVLWEIVDILRTHAVLKLPDWCWGSSIKRDAQASTNCNNEMVEVPFRYAQQRMADDLLRGQSSMVAENLRRLEKQDEASKPMFETALKRAGATAIVASYETMSSTLMVFTLAMLLYPDVQKRAQAEIDLVTGSDRLPTFEERASLPYIDAVLRETLRWQPVLPLGLPHAASSADIYDGYFIPQGATVICNTWGISRDDKRYPDASSFIPERFIDVNGALTSDDPAQFVFGLGRRICPGRYTADASLWSAIATMLATLDISSAKDDQGKDINFTPQFTTGLSYRPMIFPCNISTRSHIHSGLIGVLRAEV